MDTVKGDLLDIPAELTAALNLLREQRVRLEAAMMEKPGYNSRFQKPLSDVTVALKALSAEARQWSGQLEERSRNATPEQKTAVCLDWLSELPTGARVLAYEELVSREKTAFDKLPLVYGTR